MLVLSRPFNQDRLNAAIFEIVGLNIHGTVCIPGEEWDCYQTLGYLERRLKRPFIATMCADGSRFCICGKVVYFGQFGVFIQSRH